MFYAVTSFTDMNISKFEAVGIGASIAAMALALFLIRVQSAVFSEETAATGTQQASVIVADESAGGAAFADAVVEASDGSGRLERLILDDVVLGTGAEVAKGDTVSVHYIGTLQNGQQFDNSYQKGQPFSFTVGDGKVIRGWEDGVLGMKVGGQRIIVVPPELAYGEKGYGPIPGNATLVFAIELLEVE